MFPTPFTKIRSNFLRPKFFRRSLGQSTSKLHCTSAYNAQTVPSLSDCIAGIFYDKQRCIFATRPRGPPRGIEALPTSKRTRSRKGRAGARERVKRISVRPAKRRRVGRYRSAGCAHVCTREEADTEEAREKGEARTYNHCDYLVLGIDYGFA